MTETMRRWTVSGTGRRPLERTTVAIPEPGPGEVLVRVSAVSLNYRDRLMLESGMGLDIEFPFVPASDMAGRVVAVGSGVRRFGPGDRVISTFIPGWIDGHDQGSARVPPYRTLGGTHPGVLAEYVAFPEGWFTAAPATLDDAEASTLPVAGLTAWFALVELGRLRAGDIVLVQGTGGVALWGLQLAKAQGAAVIVTSGSDDKLARARTLGADHLVNRRSGDWVEAIYRLTGDRGVDHVLEIVGGAHLGQALRAVAVGGRISLIGVLEGFEVSGAAGDLLRKSATIQGIVVGHRRSQEDLVRAVDHLGLKPVIDRRYGFDDAPAAFEHLDRGPFGKVVVTIE